MPQGPFPWARVAQARFFHCNLSLLTRGFGVQAIDFCRECNTCRPDDNAVEISAMLDIYLITTMNIFGDELLVKNVDVGFCCLPIASLKPGNASAHEQ